MTDLARSSRGELLRRAWWLGVLTVTWNLAEGAVALGAAWAADSRALGGFGLDSGVESVSAALLLWRLGAERRDPARAEQVERRALRAIGVSFLLLAALVAVASARSLLLREKPHASPVGIVLTVLSLAVMPVLARRKRAVAVALGSRAAVADSAQTSACAWLSAVVLGGLVLNAALGWWWADPLAALGVVAFLLAEARTALTADRADDCCGP